MHAGTVIHMDRTHRVASPAVDPCRQTNTLQTTVLSVAASGWRRVVVVVKEKKKKVKLYFLWSTVEKKSRRRSLGKERRE